MEPREIVERCAQLRQTLIASQAEEFQQRIERNAEEADLSKIVNWHSRELEKLTTVVLELLEGLGALAEHSRK